MNTNRMVTRTIKSFAVKAAALDTATLTATPKEYTVPAAVGKDKLLKHLQKTHPEDVIVALLDVNEQEVLLGMLEDDFIKYAAVLPPRGTKTEN